MLIWLGSAAAVAAVLLLRRSWGLKARSTAANALAWGLLILAVALGAAGAGAWGISVVSLVATTVAFLCLAQAALASPRPKAVGVTRRTAPPPEPRCVGARLLVFLLAVPGAMVASPAVALAVRALSGLAGADESNSNTLALFLMPLLWMGIVTLLMLEPRRTRQYILVGAPLVLGGLVLVLTGAGA